MSAFFEDKDRRVIPNFRNLKKTVTLGELNPVRKSVEPFVPVDLDIYSRDFLEDQTIGNAGDLVSAALVNNLLNEKSVLQAAQFILANENISSNIQIEVAKKILKIEGITRSTNIDTLDEFLETNNRKLIRERIKFLKFQNSQFDRNPFTYTELSRLYSIIGQKEASIKNIKIAKDLAPNNRYVLRAYSS
jgi:hypothetical protein